MRINSKFEDGNGEEIVMHQKGMNFMVHDEGKVEEMSAEYLTSVYEAGV